MLKISNLRLPLDFTERDLRRAVAKRLRVPESALGTVRLAKKSIDARHRDRVCFLCAAEAETEGEANLLSRLRDDGVQRAIPYRYELPESAPPRQRPVVVGLGPAGLFAALILARCRQRPIVVERGLPVEERERSVKVFWERAVLDPESNVQFGEGGAGAFSDGKLTTGTKDVRVRLVLEELWKHGAPEEILVEGKPHIGTDRLPGVVKSIREEIVSLGGEARFSTKAAGFRLKDGALAGLELETPGGRDFLPCSQVILAVGHSARDTFYELCKLKLPMEPKAFSVGARIEHPAEVIDRAQYGRFAGHPALGAADYKLSCRLKDGRGAYTFCMCPGGTVTGAASEPGGVVTNGMSPWARDGANSNAALLVSVTPEDFGGEGPLAGVAFQREIERAAFRLGGESYRAPAQRVADFLAKTPSTGFSEVRPSYLPGAAPSSLDGCLPAFVCDGLRAALPLFGGKLKGFDMGGAALTGPETRSSSPVRILRDESFQSPLARGLYPCGEGAGYAGGIVSAAVDGVKAAEAVLLATSRKM